MMRRGERGRGWRFGMLVISGWIGILVSSSSMDASAEEPSRAPGETIQERWEGLSRGERVRARRQLRSLRRALPDFSRAERRLLLLRALQLPQPERRALRQKLRGIDDLDPQQRAALETELRSLIEESVDDVDRFNANIRRWQQMSETDREQMREQMRRFRKLPIEKRRQLLDEWVPPDPEEGERSGDKGRR